MQCNDLDFRGYLVPDKKSAVVNTIRDLHQSCLKEGASPDLALPDKSLSYSRLIEVLTAKGLVSDPNEIVMPPAEIPSNSEAMNISAPPAPDNLAAVHNEQV